MRYSLSPAGPAESKSGLTTLKPNKSRIGRLLSLPAEITYLPGNVIFHAGKTRSISSAFLGHQLAGARLAYLVKTVKKIEQKKTFNTGYSLVVTDPTTNPALTGLTRGERTGSRAFQ